jgi:hypothetical protein
MGRGWDSGAGRERMYGRYSEFAGRVGLGVSSGERCTASRHYRAGENLALRLRWLGSGRPTGLLGSPSVGFG